MKKTLLSLMALLASLSALAIEQDNNGNYLIGSAADWDAFAAIVAETPAANALMTADIDLADDQTMIGTEAVPFQGTFDGQAHKLTVNYNVTEDYVGPFRFISGATIQKLHVDGNINTTMGYAGGLVGYVISGTNQISQCMSSVNITTTQGGREWVGGFVGVCMSSGTVLNIDDCLCQANMTANWAANFVGIMYYSSHVNVTNSLSIATCPNAVQFNSIYHYIYGHGTTQNTYILNCTVSGTDHGPAGTVVTMEQLVNGSIAVALQADRTEEVWVQDEIPMLKIFLEDQPSTGLDEINAAQPKSGIRYNLMGQPVSKDYKGIVIEDGKKFIVR